MNILAIIVAAVVNMVLGALWYSPALFAKPWMRLAGMKEMKGGGAGYAVSAIGSLITAYVLAWILNLSGMHSVSEGIKVGFLAGLGFVATTMVSDYMFSGKPMQLFYINAGYRMVGLILMGVVLGAI